MKRLIALLLCLILILPLAACGSSSGSAAEKNRVISAHVDEDHVSYLVCDSGKVLTIPDSEDAFVTRDRKNLVWLSTDGVVNRVPFNADKTDLTKAEQLAEDAEDLLSVSDKGFCFSSKSDELFRFLFADKSVIEVSKDFSALIPTANGDLFYAFNGRLYYLPHDSEDSQSIASFRGSVRLWTISENTSELIWADFDESAETDTVYYYNGVENEKLFQAKNSGYGSNIVVESSPSGDYVVVYSYSDTFLMLKAPDRDFVKVDLKADIESGICTKDGALSNTTSKIDGIYAAAAADDYEAVYWVSFDGDREKVLSKVISFEVSQGLLYYLNEEKTLYKAAAGGATIGEGERIATEVDDFVVRNGYLYYMKDTVEDGDSYFVGTGTLYAYPPKAAAPVRIASDVYAQHFSYYSRPDSVFCRLFIADDGKTVLFLKNPEEHSYFTYGSLYRYTSGAKDPERIMSDVLEYNISGNTTRLHANGFTFARYIDEETSEEKDLFDWYYYNGKEAVCVARNAS